MATKTIKRRSVSSSHYDEFSGGKYIGAKKKDISDGVILGVAKYDEHDVVLIPSVGGVPAKALRPIPPLESVWPQFLLDTLSALKTGKGRFQYFGHSAFVD